MSLITSTASALKSTFENQSSTELDPILTFQIIPWTKHPPEFKKWFCYSGRRLQETDQLKL